MDWPPKDPTKIRPLVTDNQRGNTTTPSSLPQVSGPASDPVAQRIIQMQKAMQPQAQKVIADQQEELRRLELGLAQERAQAAEKRAYELHKQASEAVQEVQVLRQYLRTLCDSITLLGVDVPGYEDALAFLVQEKILTRDPKKT